MSKVIRSYMSDRVPVGLECLDESRTKQSFKDECNINTIMAKAIKSGIVPGSNYSPVFGDFSSAGDFHELQNRILEVKAVFGSLPADFRKELGEDPGNLVEWLSKPENQSRAAELGLIPQADPVPGPEPAPATPPGPEPAPQTPAE